MPEKWKEVVDKVEDFAALLMDLSKSFDFVSHDSQITKLHYFSVALFSLNLFQGYLTNRKQQPFYSIC